MSQAVLNFYEQLTASRYGAMELKRMVGPNLIKGLIFSFVVHLAIVISPFIAKIIQGEEEIPPPNVVVIDASKLTKLKRQQDDTQQQVQIAQPKMEAPVAAIPIAVDEDFIDAEPVIKSQSELTFALSAEAGSDEGLNLKSGDIIEIKGDDFGSEEDPALGQFVPVEYAPQPLDNFSPLPAYPKLAETSGVKGRVVVLCFVDKTGSVKKYQFKSVEPPNLGFAEEVEKIIMTWKFTPAIQNGKPIGVWVEIPFNFDSER